jgi:hypothetical protein
MNNNYMAELECINTMAHGNEHKLTIIMAEYG